MSLNDVSTAKTNLDIIFFLADMSGNTEKVGTHSRFSVRCTHVAYGVSKIPVMSLWGGGSPLFSIRLKAFEGTGNEKSRRGMKWREVRIEADEGAPDEDRVRCTEEIDGYKGRGRLMETESGYLPFQFSRAVIPAGD